MYICARKYQHNLAKCLIKGFCKFFRIFISPLGADIFCLSFHHATKSQQVTSPATQIQSPCCRGLMTIKAQFSMTDNAFILHVVIIRKLIINSRKTTGERILDTSWAKLKYRQPLLIIFQQTP